MASPKEGHDERATMVRNVDDVIRQLNRPEVSVLPSPIYYGRSSVGVGMAVESMKRHMTDEGWQIFAGLEHAGYTLTGHNLPVSATNVRHILNELDPGVVVMQDKREWDTQPKDFRDKYARFSEVNVLAERPDVFKLTILKDSHQKPLYHRHSAQEIGCHAWIVYYHPRIVKHLAPYVRSEHLIRTYHSIDRNVLPKFNHKRPFNCLLSGAISGAYPLRQRLMRERSRLPGMAVQRHPGYHMRGCCTPRFMNTLSNFKVAICTSSVYGYALRKIIEATACGCVVVTDLPQDEVLPEIDDNLVRIDPNISTEDLRSLLLKLYAEYDTERQLAYALSAWMFYDYKAVGQRLAGDIEIMRDSYGSSSYS